jgi:hypothetical protein
MEKSLRKVIEKVILKKYPVITGIELISSSLNRTYIDLNTSQCLDGETMVKIDTDIKSLFTAMGYRFRDSSSFSSPMIVTHFDCGDGDGFKFISPYGYKHM